MRQRGKTHLTSNRDWLEVDQLLSRVNNWAELKAEVSSLQSTRAKGNVFERVTQLFLQTSPMYQSQLKGVWRWSQLSAETIAYLGLPKQDFGIDLLAETVSGEYWAIQCKYRDDEATSLTWSELATFVGLAKGICSKISFVLVATSTEHITSLLHGKPNIGFISIDTWRHLEQDFFDNVRSLLVQKTPIKPLPFSPKPHQVLAISDAVTHFEGHGNSRGKLIAPCGSGKSLTAYWISRALKSKLTVIALPTLSLLRQTLQVWLRESVADDEQIDWKCVCSDPSTADELSVDSLVTHVFEIGVPNTNQTELIEWLSDKTSKKRIVFTTYHSSKTVANAALKSGVTFDLGVIDEAHKTVGRKDKLFSHLLFDENISIKKRLFMTATERRFIASSEKIASMEDATIYGDTFSLLTFKQALGSDEPILTDYEVIVFGVSNAEVQRYISANIFVQPDQGNWNDLTAQQLAAVIALRKVLEHREYDIGHVVSFHSTIKRAKMFREQQEAFSTLRDADRKPTCYHVSGEMPTASRDSILNKFSNDEFSIVSNARCLTEGIDIPAIDCVFFADPKQSVTDIVQAAGRAMRTAKGKKLGYIVIPVFLKNDDENGSTIFDTAFNSVFTILRALASNDERIIDYFRSVSQGARPSDSPIHFDFAEVTPEGIALDEFERALHLRTWEKLSRLAYRPFEEARNYSKSLNLKSAGEWRAYCLSGRRPLDIPANPDRYYRSNGWISFGDWLGTGNTYRGTWRDFRSARDFVRSLKLKKTADWRAYSASEERPEDIPSAPDQSYDEWHSWGDWLGTAARHPKTIGWMRFEIARNLVQNLNLKSQKAFVAAWRAGAMPEDIPQTPNLVYKDVGWHSWGDWLGTGFEHRKPWRPFTEARDYARALGLTGMMAWQKYSRGGQRPKDIPTHPNESYSEWISWGDWLGTGTVASQNRVFRSFEECRKFARSLNLKGEGFWRQYRKATTLPSDIPAAPDQIYRNSGWISWGDFLGNNTAHPSKVKKRSFTETRQFARKLNLQKVSEWREFCKSEEKPPDIPANPDKVFEQEWISWGDFLGTFSVHPMHRSWKEFEEARKIVHQLGLKNEHEWRAYAKSKRKPPDIPSTPASTYKKWVSWGDWLGTGNRRRGSETRRSFENARTFARSLKLSGESAWRKFLKSEQKPPDIPAAPNSVYRNEGWISWGDWLGTESVRNKDWRKFEDARRYVRSLHLSSESAWREYRSAGNKPADIPSNPNTVYKNKGWINWTDWLKE